MASTMPAHPAADQHTTTITGPPAAAAWVEALGHIVQLGAPGEVLVEALLGFLGDTDPLATRLLTEPRDAPRRGAFLLFWSRADVQLRKRAEHDDLVVFDRDLHAREPAVGKPAAEPTFDRTELFLIHALHDYTVISGLSTGVT